MQQVTGKKNQVARRREWSVPFIGVKGACLHACMCVAKNKLRSAKRSAKSGASGSVARCEIKNAGCKAIGVVVKRLASIVLEHIHPNLLDKPTQRLAKKQLAKGLQIEDKPMMKRSITTGPVVKPIRVNAPNSVFALGNTLMKS